MSIPANSPLSPDQQQIANQLAAGLSAEQANWLSGFYAGIAHTGAPLITAPAAKTELTILYGSESGNAEKLSGDVAKAAGKQGFKTKVVNMADANAATMS
ncbi:MAG: sulfite reductase [NADPH] flavoprotein alpha-component, partial [Gammaproteobacteria bacterium]|nr:sulfite reductase [NADPH] flavoprotein alpha-component [Gammaproteobacteria bacterium]